MPRDLRKYHASIHAEVDALQARVRNLLNDQWGEDGRYREVVVRSILRRHLPESLTVGSGFILDQAGQSSQIDVLIARKDAPVLFRDGDFMIVTSDAVAGIIEVKIGLTSTGLDDACSKLAENAERVRMDQAATVPAADIQRRGGIWAGLFVVEPRGLGDAAVLGSLARSANGQPNRVINGIALGPYLFARHWDDREEAGVGEDEWNGPRWHGYDFAILPDGGAKELAPSYFIGNCVDSCARTLNPANAFAFFSLRDFQPDGRFGKERVRQHWVGLSEREVRQF